jgi:hypothetical protein
MGRYGLRKVTTTFGPIPQGLYAQCEHRSCALWQQWWQDEGYAEVPTGLERLASLRSFWRFLREQGELASHVCIPSKIVRYDQIHENVHSPDRPASAAGVV